VPSRAEQALCAPWLAAELALIRPRVLIPIGGLAIGRFLGTDTTMTDLIGERFEREGRLIVPLPHPSGASQWFNVPDNKVRLARALELLTELRVGLLKKVEHLPPPAGAGTTAHFRLSSSVLRHHIAQGVVQWIFNSNKGTSFTKPPTSSSSTSSRV
jgi:hypothetical protein